MKRYFLLCCLLIIINLTAHDTHDQSSQKLTEVLQGLEQQIKGKKELVEDTQIYTTCAPWLVVPGALGVTFKSCLPSNYYYTRGAIGLFSFALCLISIDGVYEHLTTLPEEQKSLETLEQKKAELLKKLKEMQVK